jgi:glucose-6-phosphate 1-dehydrogenase
MSGPCHFEVFDAAGHLNRIKLLPALYHLGLVGRIAGYAAGSWGPKATKRLLDRPEHTWRNDL